MKRIGKGQQGQTLITVPNYFINVVNHSLTAREMDLDYLLLLLCQNYDTYEIEVTFDLIREVLPRYDTFSNDANMAIALKKFCKKAEGNVYGHVVNHNELITLEPVTVFDKLEVNAKESVLIAHKSKNLGF